MCIKFGNKFGPGYVNRFARAVSDNLSIPHEIVCLTDDSAGLDPAITAKPIADFGLPRERWTERGNWPKLAMFAPDVFDDDDIVLYMDLDVMVLGSLDVIFERVERHGGFHQLREWNPTLLWLLPPAWRPDRGAQGSIFCFRMREQRHIWRHFTLNADMIVSTAKGDRSYWTRIAWRPQYLPYDWAASFKRHCTLYYPLSLLRPVPKRPDWARVLVFHGRPQPEQLASPDLKRWGSGRRRGKGPIPWIVEYFQHYDSEPKHEDAQTTQ